ncbi:MAG TPA: hypothetical protein VM537_12320 [Anaerolineae bacterium]|nr:hypothetical protein [Anaerolineae bacterium]
MQVEFVHDLAVTGRTYRAGEIIEVSNAVAATLWQQGTVKRLDMPEGNRVESVLEDRKPPKAQRARRRAQAP